MVLPLGSNVHTFVSPETLEIEILKNDLVFLHTNKLLCDRFTF